MTYLRDLVLTLWAFSVPLDFPKMVFRSRGVITRGFSKLRLTIVVRKSDPQEETRLGCLSYIKTNAKYLAPTWENTNHSLLPQTAPQGCPLTSRASPEDLTYGNCPLPVDRSEGPTNNGGDVCHAGVHRHCSYYTLCIGGREKHRHIPEMSSI